MSRPGFRSIVRARVMQRMVQACAYPVALIVAPAGYGKTVALRQYLQSLDLPHVRFDVRPEHETLPGFVRGFAEAVAHVAPEMRAALGDALRGPSTAAHLAEWAATHLRDFRGVIAIDDLHLALDHGVALFLRSLTERLKGQVRWVFASRSAPQLPIATWMTYGDMDMAVDERDLAFTVEEAEQAGDETGACEDELRRFVEMTGGWATALSFAMRSRVRTSELKEIGHATREMVYRYLAEQVYDQLSDAERQLLHLAAYLPTIDVDLLVAAGFPDAYAMLEQLRKRTAFLSIEGQRTYRCHDLFRDFLRDRVELMGSAVVRGLQLRAAALLENQNQVDSALRLYSAAGACGDVSRVLEANGNHLIDRGEGDVVRSALAMLSATEAFQRPSIVGVRAWAEYIDGRYDEAERLFQTAIGRCADPAQKDELTLRLASLLYNQGAEATELLEDLRRTAQSEEVRANALSWLPAHYARKAEPLKAKRILNELLARLPDSISPLTTGRAYLRAGIAVLALELDPQLATRLFRQAHEIASRHRFYSVSAAALAGLSNVHLVYEDDPEAAMPYALTSLSSANLSGDRFHVELAMIRIAHLSARAGNRAKLAEIMETLRRIPSTNKQVKSFVGEMLETIAAWDGNFESAVRFADSASKLVLDGDRQFVSAQQALYLAANGQRDDAIASACGVLQALAVAKFSVLHSVRQAECARLLCAIAQAAGGRRSAARQILRAVPFADAPYIRTLTRIAELYACGDDLQFKADGVMPDLLARLHAEGRGGLALILAQFFERVRSAQGERENVLTPSELDVLRKLDLGFAPKQIAAETGRSVHTVRTLIQRAVTKLDCSGRQEALAAARRAGLLNPDLRAASGT